MQKTEFQSLVQENALEKEMATHSSILARRTPWTEEPSGLQSMGLQTVGHDLIKQQQQQLYSTGNYIYYSVINRKRKE